MRIEYQSIGIEQARDIREFLQLRGVGESYEIYFEEITEEAQNALLKILEDLPAGQIVTLICPRPDILLPTLLSRGVVSMAEPTEIKPSERGFRERFFRLSVSERLQFVETLFPKDPTPEEKVKARADAKKLVQAVTYQVYRLEKGSHRYNVLRDIERARKHLDAKELPARTVLEHLALVL